MLDFRMNFRPLSLLSRLFVSRHAWQQAFSNNAQKIKLVKLCSPKTNKYLKRISIIEKENIICPKWVRETYGSAEDMRLLASIISKNREVVAAGAQYSVKEAILEVSEMEEIKQVKFVALGYKLQRVFNHYGIVLENLNAPSNSKTVLVVTLDMPKPDLLA
jgi:hypothetical protein